MYLLLLFLSFCSFAATKSVDDLLSQLGSRTQHSISAYDLNTGKSVLSHKGSEPLIAASLTKLFSSSYYLKTLGPDYQIPTDFLIEKSIESDGTLNSSLYVKGYGNPFYVTEDLYISSQEMRLAGIKTIKGDIVIDPSFFQKEVDSINGYSDDSTRAYSAKISATSLNFNSFTVRGTLKGGKCILALDPIDSGYIRIKLNVSSNLKPSGILKSKGEDFEEYAISGCQGTGYISLENPPLYFGHTFKKFLELQGIKVLGKVKIGKTPSSADLIFHQKSKTIFDLVKDMNTWSNNFMSEMLLLHLAGKMTNSPASFESGLKLLNAYLKEIDPQQKPVLNASGLTGQNQLSCDFLNKAMFAIRKDPLDVSSHYMSLARPGVDGTLHNRHFLVGKSLSGKTGTLTVPKTVAGLAGYLVTKAKKEMSFCILLNNFPDMQEAREVIDKIALKIIEDN